MPILQLILILVVIGVAMWLINAYIPMAEPIKTILNVVVIVAVLVWLANVFGAFAGHGLGNVPRIGGH
jgi:hypothetical protein